MCSQVNILEEATAVIPDKQTVELRSADGSADIYLLIAAMCVAARDGFEMQEALKRAEELYVSVNIHNEESKDKLASLKGLPDSCEASADALEKDRDIFEKDDVFHQDMISGIAENLRNFKDGQLRKQIGDDREKMLSEVRKYWHCG